MHRHLMRLCSSIAQHHALYPLCSLCPSVRGNVMVLLESLSFAEPEDSPPTIWPQGWQWSRFPLHALPIWPFCECQQTVMTSVNAREKCSLSCHEGSVVVYCNLGQVRCCIQKYIERKGVACN